MFGVIDSSNLPSAVAFALEAVSRRLNEVNLSQFEIRDLEVAMSALSIIKKELESGEFRSKGQRSGEFTRYAIDETPNLEVDDELRRIIVRIEELYKRY